MKTSKFRFIMSVALILGFMIPMSALANTVGSCSITIDANVHTNGNLAYGTGKCGHKNEGVYGFYQGGSFWVDSDRLEQVKNGQVLKNRSVMGVGYMDIHVTTIPLKQSEPKPAPKPEPKPQPAPKPTPKPKDPPKQPAPKPEPKPKQTTPKTSTPKSSTPKTSTPKQSTAQKPSSSNTTRSTQNKQPSTNAQKKTQSNTQQKAPTPQEVKNWTVKELKEKNAKVEEKAGKLFATIDGVSKEITKDEAEELGHEVEEEEEQEIEEKTELVEEEEKEETPKKKKSFVPYLLGGLGLGVPTLGALGYAYFRRKSYWIYKNNKTTN